MIRLLIPFLFSLNAFAAADCQPQVEQVVHSLLNIEGFTNFVRCDSVQYNHCLSFSRADDQNGFQVYQAQLTFGGFYYNTQDYVVTVDMYCQVHKIEIFRE